MNTARIFGAIVVLSAIAFVLGDYQTDVYRKLLLWVMLALGFNFLFGIAGQLAFSHFAFYGLGAYSIVILLAKMQLPLPLAVVAATVLCAAVALAIAVPATRLQGFYLALATLAFSQLFVVLLNAGGTLTGGTGGLSNYRLPPIFGYRLAGPSYTIVIVLLLVGTFVILQRLDRSWFGRACRALRDNPEAAAAMGVDVARTRILAFVLTSTLAGMAGMAYAFVDNTINPPIFGVENAFLLVFMIIIGGTGSQAGAVIGAILLYLLPFVVGPLIGAHHVLVFGLLVVAVILLEPRGLIGIYESVRARARRAPV